VHSPCQLAEADMVPVRRDSGFDLNGKCRRILAD